MKMTAKQKAVFRQIARGEVKLWVNTTGKTRERVLVAINTAGSKVNLQVDWLLAKDLIVLGDVPLSQYAGQEIFVKPGRGEKILASLTV